MDLLRNSFKATLQRNETQIGLWLALASPYSAEICAGVGFDWLLIDSEHAPNDVRTILQQLQTLAAYPVRPVVRPPVGDVHLIKQLLDIGADSLLIPMVESAEQARQLVTAVRYPPRGIRGVGSALARASRWNGIDGYLQNADREVCLIAQIENTAGLKNLEEIASVDGVDGIFFGPADLAASLGYLGNPTHAEVQRVIVDAIQRVSSIGKPSGVLSSDEQFARLCMASGCSFVAVGADTTLLSRHCRELAQRFKHSSPAMPQPGGVY
jgi:4-hydroxy-2-oxoheptanedioate aldolase